MLINVSYRNELIEIFESPSQGLTFLFITQSINKKERLDYHFHLHLFKNSDDRLS